MRRAFWLTTGAVLGVVGYRRIDRTVRSLTGPAVALRPASSQPLQPLQPISPSPAALRAASPQAASPQAASPQAASPQAASPQAASPQAAGPQAAGPRLIGPPAAASLVVGLVRWTATRLRARRSARRDGDVGFAAFIGDVRTGMAEYLDSHEPNPNRQHARSGSTLVDQRAIRSAVTPGARRATLAISGREPGHRPSPPRRPQSRRPESRGAEARRPEGGEPPASAL
jgi:hypothetical protein